MYVFRVEDEMPDSWWVVAWRPDLPGVSEVFHFPVTGARIERARERLLARESPARCAAGAARRR